MTNRRDLFDEEPQEGRATTGRETAGDSSRETPAAEAGRGGANGGDGGKDGAGPESRNVSRRSFLWGAGAAAAAGAVVGAGVAAGVGVGGGGEEALTEREGMTLGAPPGRAVSEAVIKLVVNNQPQWLRVGSHETLAEVLRGQLGLTGTKVACDRSECSACTVLVDGVPQNSCSLLAIREDGKEISTIEGQLTNGELSPVQQAFVDHMGLQCGFCTPGQVMQATALLQNNKKPDEAQIRRAMSGNLCKCSAYANIVEAIQAASSQVPGQA